VTSHPTADNAGHWWLVTGKWRRLHAIPGSVIAAGEMRDAIDTAEPIRARAACQLNRRWDMPGMFSRLGASRCTACCTALGIPAGNGTPANNTTQGPK
jgi:hypothetical protein